MPSSPEPTAARDRALDEAAQRLLAARASGVACAPLRHLLADATVDDGYAVQQRVIARTSTPDVRQVGRKIGLTSPVVQRQMGVSTPDFGVLFSDMAFGDSEPVPLARLMQPRVEAEIAFVLGADLPERHVTHADVLRCTDFVVAAIEVVDSRIADWDISIFDTVADNASSGVYVLGGQPKRLTDIGDLRDLTMSLTHDGVEVSSGAGAACLGHPVNAVVWLANVVAERGAPLRAGELILSGSLGPLVAVGAAGTYQASIGGLGSVRAVFAD